ncbi:hypothetical protein [Terriglobus aquaticus]|uniref:Lipoprotein n=1 Tax=Terriglobus aquaticus TaxID=940139 RepID=A0ABW9KNI2_9BACT|nr:hypothetical protein [Terriglobus aquaticus]
MLPLLKKIHAACLLSAVLVTAGCHVSSKGSDGREDVDIRTPLGGLAVKTDPSAVLGKIGLPAYPGAVQVKEKGSDKDSADVNMSFGSFHLRVLALGFQTGDDRAKVEAFYRKALHQYSDVIACQGESPIGEPARTGLGLTCKGDRHFHGNIHYGDSAGNINDEFTLKAGSPSRQHIVAMQDKQDGTHFTLIALDLPDDH